MSSFIIIFYQFFSRIKSYFQGAVNNVPAFSNPGLNILLGALQGEKILQATSAEGGVERCHGFNTSFTFTFETVDPFKLSHLI